MASVLARGWIFEASDGSGGWLEIERTHEFDLDRSANNEEADDTVNASDGVYEGQVVQRGSTLELTANHAWNGSQVAAGQARVEEMSGDEATGPDSLYQIRWRYKTEALWRVWTCYSIMGGRGGDKNALASWVVTFTKSGKETTATVVD